MTKKHIFDTEGFSAERKKEAENLKKTLLDQAAGQESPIGGFAAEIEESMKAGNCVRHRPPSHTS